MVFAALHTTVRSNLYLRGEVGIKEKVHLNSDYCGSARSPLSMAGLTSVVCVLGFAKSRRVHRECLDGVECLSQKCRVFSVGLLGLSLWGYTRGGG